MFMSLAARVHIKYCLKRIRSMIYIYYDSKDGASCDWLLPYLIVMWLAFPSSLRNMKSSVYSIFEDVDVTKFPCFEQVYTW